MRIYDFEGKKNISGERIREARLKLRLSQSDLAARVQVEGVTMERDSISRIEIGTRFIPVINTSRTAFFSRSQIKTSRKRATVKRSIEQSARNRLGHPAARA